VPNIHPIAPEYNNEIYLSNRFLAFEEGQVEVYEVRQSEKLQAHHIEPIPVGTVFDPKVVHRVENLSDIVHELPQ